MPKRAPISIEFYLPRGDNAIAQTAMQPETMIQIILVLLAPVLVLIILARWRRTIALNVLTAYSSVLLMLGAGEIYFRYFHAQSENVLSLSTVNWLERYYEENDLGYRDRDWQPEDWAGKTTVAVVGDSFTAGWGLENPDDRYTNVLARELGDDYAVLNLGIYGTATEQQLENLQAHPLEDPDVVILQYYLNDISYTQLRLGLQLQVPPTPYWARKSYLGNFVWVRLRPLFVETDDWVSYDLNSYDNDGIWSVHREEIESFIDHVEAIDARLIVVIFPLMAEPVRSVPYVDRVAQVFEARGHTDILKLFEAANAWPLEDRIVSLRDTHPSVAFHEFVGKELYRQFFES